jgi:hypothetical protein
MRVNTETAPKITMRRPTLPGQGEGWHGSDANWTTGLIRFAGVVGDSMPTRIDEQHGKPALVAAAIARPTGAKGACPERVAEGLIVPMKPGNAGGGKGPWFWGADEAARGRGD